MAFSGEFVCIRVNRPFKRSLSEMSDSSSVSTIEEEGGLGGEPPYKSIRINGQASRRRRRVSGRGKSPAKKREDKAFYHMIRDLSWLWSGYDDRTKSKHARLAMKTEHCAVHHWWPVLDKWRKEHVLFEEEFAQPCIGRLCHHGMEWISKARDKSVYREIRSSQFENKKALHTLCGSRGKTKYLYQRVHFFMPDRSDPVASFTIPWKLHKGSCMVKNMSPRFESSRITGTGECVFEWTVPGITKPVYFFIRGGPSNLQTVQSGGLNNRLGTALDCPKKILVVVFAWDDDAKGKFSHIPKQFECSVCVPKEYTQLHVVSKFFSDQGTKNPLKEECTVLNNGSVSPYLPPRPSHQPSSSTSSSSSLSLSPMSPDLPPIPLAIPFFVEEPLLPPLLTPPPPPAPKLLPPPLPPSSSFSPSSFALPYLPPPPPFSPQNHFDSLPPPRLPFFFDSPFYELVRIEPVTHQPAWSLPVLDSEFDEKPFESDWPGEEYDEPLFYIE